MISGMRKLIKQTSKADKWWFVFIPFLNFMIIADVIAELTTLDDNEYKILKWGSLSCLVPIFGGAAIIVYLMFYVCMLVKMMTAIECRTLTIVSLFIPGLNLIYWHFLSNDVEKYYESN
jgi:hypothetical protein